MLKQLPTYLYAQTTPHLPICSNNSPFTYMLKQLPPTYMLKQLPTYLYAQTTPHLPISSKNLPPTYMLKQLPTAHVLHDKEDPVAVVE